MVKIWLKTHFKGGYFEPVTATIFLIFVA